MRQISVFCLLWLSVVGTGAAAQNTMPPQVVCNISGCSEIALPKPHYSDASAFSVQQIWTVVNEIMQVSGLMLNFQVVETNKVDNAAAVIMEGERYLAYNSEWLALYESDPDARWQIYGAMAHEIGHHLQGHTITGKGSRPPSELEADEYAGFTLAALGANLSEAQSLWATLSKSGSVTHPPRHQRLAAVERGWMRREDQMQGATQPTAKAPASNDSSAQAGQSRSTTSAPNDGAIARKYALAESHNSSAAWRAFLNDYQNLPDNFYVVLALDALSRLEGPKIQASRHLPLPNTRMQECYTRRFGEILSKLCVSSVLGAQSGNSYSGDNLADGNMNTAWVEGDAGDGLGEVLRFSFEGPTTTNEILIANGYNKSQSAYSKNGRVRSFNVRTSTGFEGDIQVVDSGRFQVLNLPYLGDVNWITLTLTGVHRGTKYRDTAISELRFQ